MCCTKILPRVLAVAILAMLLTSCAQTLSHEPVTASSDAATAATADEELGLFQQATAALARGDLDAAQNQFETLTRRRPQLAGPWMNLALIDIKRKDFAGAETHLAQALERNPKLPQAYNALGTVELSKGNLTAALADYRKAIAFKDDYAIAHYNLALINDVYLHDLVAAVQHYKRYLQLTNPPDQKTSDWVAELERRLSKGAQ